MDPHIRKIYTAPPNKRHEYVQKAAMAQCLPPILFLYLECDFSIKPNKKKALFLFEHFLYGICHSTHHGMNIPEDGFLTINMEVAKPGVVEALRASFEQIDRDRTKAKKMNIFKRISSSKDRKSAHKDVFAAFRQELLENHGEYEGPWSAILSGGIDSINRPKSQNIYQKNMQSLRNLHNEMSNCGFDLKYTGVDSWTVNLSELGF